MMYDVLQAYEGDDQKSEWCTPTKEIAKEVREKRIRQNQHSVRESQPLKSEQTQEG